MLRWLVFVLCVAAGCGGRKGASSAAGVGAVKELSPEERVLALLPEATQVVIEVDLARLRANALVGPVLTRLVAQPE